MPMLVAFEVWKQDLRNDCAKQGKLQAYHALGDSVLRVLYESGLEPSVEAIAKDCEAEINLY